MAKVNTLQEQLKHADTFRAHVLPILSVAAGILDRWLTGQEPTESDRRALLEAVRVYREGRSASRWMAQQVGADWWTWPAI